MINIISSPENYAPAFGDIIYELESTVASDNFEVEIYDSTLGNLLGVKRYTDMESYQVYVADYLQYQFDIEPLSSSACTLQEDVQKLKGVAIKVDGQELSEISWHTFAIEPAEQKTLMSAAPLSRRIAWNQQDELSIIAPDCEVTAIYTLSGSGDDVVACETSLETDSGVVSLLTDMSYIEQKIIDKGLSPDDFSMMTISLEVDDLQVAEIVYQIETAAEGDRRICWINKYGAMDYYSFEGSRQAQMQVSKTRIYSSEGYMVTSSEASKIITLYSRFEPEQTMTWLAEMLASPKVWMEGDDGDYTPVDITTQSVVYQDEDLMRMQIAVRSTNNQLFQHN